MTLLAGIVIVCLFTTTVWSDESPAPGKLNHSLICGPGLHFDEPSGRCRRDVPLTKENRPPCKDTVTTVDGREIPYKEAKELTGRLYEQLTGIHYDPLESRALTTEEVNKAKRFGIISVPCDGRGITVETDAPERLPKEFEGIPVLPLPLEVPYMLSHTTSSLFNR